MQPESTWRYAPQPHPCVEAIDAFEDNYIWSLHTPGSDSAVVVDPGDAAPVQRWLSARALRLAAILLTHHHPDHVGGVRELVEHWRPVVHGPAGESIAGVDHRLSGGDTITVADTGATLRVLDVPGHTRGHIAYVAEPFGGDPRPLLFCGDTLFAAGCGRLFEGTPAQMLDSLDRLAALDPETLVYCAHEYTLSNLRFAAAAEPDGEAVHARLDEARRMRAAGARTVPSSIAIELATNPFLRVDAAGVLAAIAGRLGHAPVSRLDSFTALRAWKDGFR
ncbi:MAG: hydroxyacylglutathione hydrolase [Burkholderiaceae bacterium]|nr:hydroxyacylglutathione hydrolase [Burkholderiaceae bacterium]MEB2350796.1 hydroxyacylglutathione hydrolase [Burkholderiaceae bacterium]